MRLMSERENTQGKQALRWRSRQTVQPAYQLLITPRYENLSALCGRDGKESRV